MKLTDYITSFWDILHLNSNIKLNSDEFLALYKVLVAYFSRAWKLRLFA